MGIDTIIVPYLPCNIITGMNIHLNDATDCQFLITRSDSLIPGEKESYMLYIFRVGQYLDTFVHLSMYL